MDSEQERGADPRPDHRLAICAGQLIEQLQAHILGSAELTPTQLRAAEILLKKTLPDLQTIQQKGGTGTGPMHLTIRFVD